MLDMASSVQQLARMTVGDESDAVTAFARAAARLADPFADRAVVLSELQLDETRWRALETEWFCEWARRKAAGDPALADRFREAYANARDAILAARRAAHAPRAVIHPPVARSPLVEATATAIPALTPALPFRGKRDSASWLAPQGALAPPPSAPAEPSASVDSTAILEEPHVETTLPFGKPKRS